MKVRLFSLIAVVILASGCTSQDYDYSGIGTTTTTATVSIQQTTTTEKPGAGTPVIMAGNSGTKYLRFTKEHYQKSLSEGKVVHLYFYANWCPICAEERPKIFAAYSRLNYSDVVGYEVHYNDNEVTDDDLFVTRFYQIPYQHTTVILNKKGAVYFKSFATIGTERLIEEIIKARNV